MIFESRFLFISVYFWEFDRFQTDKLNFKGIYKLKWISNHFKIREIHKTKSDMQSFINRTSAFDQAYIQRFLDKKEGSTAIDTDDHKSSGS